MAKRRYVKDSFRSDGWIEGLEPLERYLYLYLITNEYVSCCGIYEINIKRISFETGIEQKEIERIMDVFKQAQKIYYNDGIIFIVNFVKNQSIKKETDNLRIGIEREVKELGPEKLNKVLSLEGAYKVVEGAYKVVGIPYLTLLYSTLPNLTLPNSTGPSQGLGSDGDDFIEDIEAHAEKVLHEQTTGFEQAYSLFPKKTGKSKSRNSFAIALRFASFDEIVRGVRLYAKKTKIEGVEEKYIKSFSNWLNEKMWQDDYSKYEGTGPPKKEEKKPIKPIDTEGRRKVIEMLGERKKQLFAKS